MREIFQGGSLGRVASYQPVTKVLLIIVNDFINVLGHEIEIRVGMEWEKYINLSKPPRHIIARGSLRFKTVLRCFRYSLGSGAPDSYEILFSKIFLL